MTVRFQADADLNHNILLAVRRIEPAIDFQDATLAHLVGLSDPEVLAQCADDGRVLISHDSRTMPHHFADFLGSRDSWGVLIVSQRLPILQVAEEIVMIWSLTEPEEWVNRIRYLPL